jgi:hypothetical protein
LSELIPYTYIAEICGKLFIHKNKFTTAADVNNKNYFFIWMPMFNIRITISVSANNLSVYLICMKKSSQIPEPQTGRKKIR